MRAADITIGVEEEVAVVSKESGALQAHDYAKSRHLLSAERGTVDKELMAACLELRTDVCQTALEAACQLAKLREQAATMAASQGQAIMAAGLHPFSDERGQALNSGIGEEATHYARVLFEHQALSREACSFGMHVHLGLPTATHRIGVMNHLREFLPLLVALSANSPFHQGHDTGLESFRPSIFGRLPRTGLPDVWASEEAYFEHLQELRLYGAVSSEGALWEDIRLHHRYGTLEVRVFDTATSLETAAVLIAMTHVEGLALLWEHECGRVLEAALPSRQIEQNLWWARRYGTRATFVDWRRGVRVEMVQVARDWLGAREEALEALGLETWLPARLVQLADSGSGAAWQRQMHNEVGLRGLVASLCAATAARPAGLECSVGR